MALLSKLLWQRGFLLSSLNPHSQLQLPRFMTHSTLTIPGILLKMSRTGFLKKAVLSLMSGTIPGICLYTFQRHDTEKVQARFDAIDTRFDAIDTRLSTMDTRLGRLDQDVKDLSAQATDCTADCAAAKRALLGYGLLPKP